MGTKIALIAERWLLGAAFLAALAACGDDSDSVLSGAGESCTKTADCGGGLKCVNLVCIQQGSGGTGPSLATGMWTDPSSELTWQVTPPEGTYDWEGAKAYCDTLSLGNHTDWRLPTIGELRTLVRGCPATEVGGSCNVDEGGCLLWSCRDDSCQGCDIGGGPAEGGMYWPDELDGESEGENYGWYWSSSPMNDQEGAWPVVFDDAGLHVTLLEYDFRVRCVR